MYLLLLFLNHADEPEKMIQRLRQFGVPDPMLIRARSAASALSAEVPVFAGLRSLALGADEDRMVLVSLKSFATPEDAERLIARIQLELDADLPPSGRLVGLPVISAQRQGNPNSRE